MQFRKKMRVSKRKIFYSFILILISLWSLDILLQSNREIAYTHNINLISQSNSLEYQLKTSAYSDIISINNNSDIKQIASSGNGSQSNPYLIEDLTINGNGNLYSILINNTNKYFILTDCLFYNSTCGLFVNNVSNGFISLNFLRDNSRTGLFIKNSINISIINNVIFNNIDYGVHLVNSNNTEIDDNSIYNNGNAGVFLNYSNNNNITFNSIDNNYYGILLHNSNYSIVSNNNGEENVYGVEEINCEGNIIENNNLSRILGIREKEEGLNTDQREEFLDFTIIFLMCASFFIPSFFFLKLFLRRFHLNEL